MFHSLDKVFRPCDYDNLDNHKEVMSLENLRAGNCTWLTYQVLLEWVTDMVNMTLSLPQHQENRFKYILAEIYTSQKRIGIGKWYRVLGKHRFMDIVLPCAQGLFSHIQ